jgi:hypothetical protein
VSGPNYSLLTQTDLDLTALDGTVEHVGEIVVARRPNNPLYQWGNFLLLSGPPEVTESPGELEVSIASYATPRRLAPQSLRWYS